MARVGFALEMLKARLDPERRLCPYCQSRHSSLLQRKWLVIQARQCAYCGLIFRWPTDRGVSTRAFYESAYEGQQATDVPGADELEALVRAGFRGSQYDKSHRVRFLSAVGLATGSLLDFGCSWGYSVFQYRAAGFDAVGHELDRNRARYGRERLALDIDSGPPQRAAGFDVVLSDHSLEHMPDPGEGLEIFSRSCKPGGRLVVFVPNGACLDARRRGVGVAGGPYIGESHTVAFTPEWFARNLPRHGFAPAFYTSLGERLAGDDYLANQDEIALVAARQ